MSYVLIVGGKSGIAQSLAKVYAKNGFNLFLAARKKEELEIFANDLSIRYGKDVRTVELDILDYVSHQKFYDSLHERPIGCFFCVGYLGDQEKAQKYFFEAEKIIATNYTGVVSLANIIANDFEKRCEGFIVGLSSVAGDRGRAKNYLYGSAKAALTTYLSGLRNRLSKNMVHVMTVLPGFVATKMTEGMDLPKRLTANPDQVALDIYRAQVRKKSVIYTRPYWRLIMMAIKSIPEFQFKKMNL